MKKLISIVLLLFPAFGFCQYVPQFSQLINSFEFINPGYNASKDLASAVIINRYQFAGIAGAPKTYGFNANVPVNNWHTGFGVNTLLETRGLFTQTNVDLTACVDVKASTTSYLAFGLSGGVESKQIDHRRAVWFGDQSFSTDNFNSNNMHAGIGLNYFSKKMHLGASMHYSQLEGNLHNENEYYTFFLNGSYLIPINDNWICKPSVLYRRYAVYNDFEYGAFFLYKDIVWAGISNRWNNALIFFADVKIFDFARIGYSYDLGIRRTADFNYGSHEIRIEFTAPRKSKKFDRMASL